jgi:hypothetical protein
MKKAALPGLPFLCLENTEAFAMGSSERAWGHRRAGIGLLSALPLSGITVSGPGHRRLPPGEAQRFPKAEGTRGRTCDAHSSETWAGWNQTGIPEQIFIVFH